MKISVFFLMLFLILVFQNPGTVWAQEHAPDFLRLGTQAFRNKQYDMAISYYNSAIDEDTNYWPAYQALGTLYYIKKNYKEALKNFQKAFDLNPDSEPLRKFVSYLRVKQGQSPLPMATPTPVFKMPQAVPAQ